MVALTDVTVTGALGGFSGFFRARWQGAWRFQVAGRLAASCGCGGGVEVRGGSAKGGRALGDLRTVSCGLLSCGLSSRCYAWSAGWGRTLPWPRPFHWTAARGIVGIRRSRRLRHLRRRRLRRRRCARLPRLDALCTHRRLVHLLTSPLRPALLRRCRFGLLRLLLVLVGLPLPLLLLLLLLQRPRGRSRAEARPAARGDDRRGDPLASPTCGALAPPALELPP